MSTSVCPRCGASLVDPAARFCAGCGQPLSEASAAVSPAGAAGARKFPVLPIVIFGGGLVALVGALLYMRSGASPAGTPVPPAPVAAPSPGLPAAPASAQTAAPLPGEPAAPATTSVFSFPETVPAAAPAGPGAAPPSGPADTGAGAVRPPSSKSWKDPLAPGAAPEPPPGRAPSAAAAPPPPPPGRSASHPEARPAAPVPPKVSQTFDCRENAIFNITPEDIVITVDGQSIGTADRWDGASDGKKYTFRGEGTHLVKLSHPNYETVWLKFEVSERSIYRTADVELQMKRLER